MNSLFIKLVPYLKITFRVWLLIVKREAPNKRVWLKKPHL